MVEVAVNIYQTSSLGVPPQTAGKPEGVAAARVPKVGVQLPHELPGVNTAGPPQSSLQGGPEPDTQIVAVILAGIFEL